MPAFIDRTGETAIATNGQKMTIIACRGYKDIDIRFEDGTVVKNKKYENFKNGKIRNPTLDPIGKDDQSENRMGEINKATNGLKMSVIGYRNAMDVDIRFEDGTVVKNKKYERFKKGAIKHPNISNFHNKTKFHDNPIGYLYHTELHGIAYIYQDTTFYYTYCPICQSPKIMSFEHIRTHKCNINHPDQKLLV